MSETYLITERETADGSDFVVRHKSGRHVAVFADESDARRFVAGEKAVEAVEAARVVAEECRRDVNNSACTKSLKTLRDAIVQYDSTLTSEATKHE